MNEDVHRGGCACGAVRYEVRGALRPVVVCHCRQCRRHSGHQHAATRARKADLAVTGTDALSWYRSSEKARRGFCGTCGSPLFWEPFEGDNVSILAGSLDTASGLVTIGHVYVAEKGDYYAIDDGLPQLEGGGSDVFLKDRG